MGNRGREGKMDPDREGEMAPHREWEIGVGKGRWARIEKGR